MHVHFKIGRSVVFLVQTLFTCFLSDKCILTSIWFQYTWLFSVKIGWLRIYQCMWSMYLQYLVITCISTILISWIWNSTIRKQTTWISGMWNPNSVMESYKIVFFKFYNIWTTLPVQMNLQRKKIHIDTTSTSFIRHSYFY